MDKPKVNWLDKTISFFSPTTGLRRERARMASSFLRGYEGASVGRRTDGWTTSGSDANAEVHSGLRWLRNRSRDLVRNNPFAARAVDVVVGNTIGHGITGNFDIEGGDPKKARDAWKRWTETTACDFAGGQTFAGLQQTSFRSIFEGGGVLLRRIRTRPDKKNLRIPLQLQILEPDFIDIDKQGDRIIQGIQFDAAGKVEGYWLWNQHPGAPNINANLTSSFVPASECRYVFRADRAGQLHGVPWSSPVMVMLKDLGDLMDATLYKQKISACFTAFVHDIDGEGATLPGSGLKAPALGEKMEPGIIEVLPGGKDITFANPPSAADFPSFTTAMLKAIAAGMGPTYEAMTGDLAGVNFSSGRMGRLEFYRLVDQWQWNMFIPLWCGAVEDWVQEAMELVGLIFVDQPMAWSWTPPRREMIDPVQETNAAVTAVRAGVKTLRQVHEEYGEDHEDLLAQIGKTNEIIDENELVLDSDPRKITKSGMFQAGPTPGTEAQIDPNDATTEENPAEN